MKRFVIFANNVEVEQTDDILEAFDAAQVYDDEGFVPTIYDRMYEVEVRFRQEVTA